MTEQHACQAWLIHQYPIRDHLYLLYMLTPDRLLKGFYRVPKKPYTIKPQAFCPYWVSWKENKNAINIQHLESNQPSLNLSGLQLFVGLYLNELIFNLCRDEQVVPEFYQLYQQLLHAGEPLDEGLLRQFEWQILADCGYAIDFTATNQQHSIKAELYYQFDPNLGFSESEDGMEGHQLLSIASGRIEQPNTFKLLKRILRQTIDHVLEGRPLHSRQLLRQWLQSNA